MYKVEVDISDWSWAEDEVVVIETNDFEKAQIIVEFIEFQKDHGWAVDYDVIEESEDAQCDEEDEEEEGEEDEETEYAVGDIVEDEDGLVWELVG
jgi:hypothetical protein